MRNLKIFAIFAAVMALSACSGNGARREAAAALVENARELVAAHQYDSALVVLDTLNVKYRDCLDQRQDGTRVRLEALAALTRDSIAAAELQLRAVNLEVDSLAPQFKKIDVAGTDGYYVDKNVYTGNEMASTGIQVRVDDKGYCFLVANVAGRRIGLERIALGNISTPAAKCIDVEGSEIMSVTQEQAADLLNALSQTSGKAALTLVGSKGKADVSLNSKQLQSIAETWRYARGLQQRRALSIRLEKLERQLAKLSDQQASLIPTTE